MPLETPAQIERRLRYSGGVEVTVGAVTSYGHLEKPPVSVLQESGMSGVRGIRKMVTIADGIFAEGAVVEDAAITVDGTGYVVRGFLDDENDDGALVHVLLGSA